MVVGPTGIGKSCLLDEVLSHERFEAYETAEGTMRPLIRFEAPDTPTSKSISQLFLKTQGDPHWEKDARKHQNLLMNRAFNYLRRQKTEVVVIDEAQGFLAKTGSYAASDFIKRILNQAVCPVILVGLPNTLDLLDNDQFGGRCDLIIEMYPYSWFDSVQQMEYRQILKGLQERVPALQSSLSLSSLAVAGALNYASYGLLRETRKLLQAAIAAAAGAPIATDHLAIAVDSRRHQRRRLGSENRGNPFKPAFKIPDLWEAAAFTQGQKKKAA
jgi:Cdc6-like AAA superfamily ATPase